MSPPTAHHATAVPLDPSSPRSAPDEVLETLLLAQREPYMRLSVAERIGPGLRDARTEAAHYQGSLGLAQRRIRRMEPELDRLRRITKGQEPKELYAQLRHSQSVADHATLSAQSSEQRLAIATELLADERAKHATELSAVRSMQREHAQMRLAVSHAVALRRIKRQDAQLAELRLALRDKEEEQAAVASKLKQIVADVGKQRAAEEAKAEARLQAQADEHARDLGRVRAMLKLSLALGLGWCEGDGSEEREHAAVKAQLEASTAEAEQLRARLIALEAEGERERSETGAARSAERQAQSSALEALEALYERDTARLRTAVKLCVALGLSYGSGLSEEEAEAAYDDAEGDSLESSTDEAAAPREPAPTDEQAAGGGQGPGAQDREAARRAGARGGTHDHEVEDRPPSRLEEGQAAGGADPRGTVSVELRELA